jgi:hypothetical protein
MGTLLSRAALGAALCAACFALHDAGAAESGDRHQFQIEVDAGYFASDSDLAAWTERGLGKLRFAEPNDGFKSARLFAQYRGRIAPTLTATVIGDYLDDADAGVDLTEAFIDWRPIPKSANQQQLRFGAFYPPLSLENGELGWHSPFTYSYSAINTWLGEEIRPFGAEWSLRRRLGFAGSPHELRAFAAAFYGNDPAGTFLFWRGWSLHDRQTRFDDRLPMPPMPIWNWTGAIVGYRDNSVEPFHEIDHEPGAYAGVEWRYAKRALVQVARYDNRADPYSYGSGQWGWHTAFSHLGVQASLPAQLGVIAQWMRGDTYWIQGAGANGTLSAFSSLVEDVFDSRFVMLTRVLRGAHRLSARYDDFEMYRESSEPRQRSDDGRAWTLGYRYERSKRLSAGIEWLEIDSHRDLWSFYSPVTDAKERQVRLQVSYRLIDPAR